MWYNLTFIDVFRNEIYFTEWQKKTVDYLNDHKNIKKVWLVNNIRHTGATTFAKLLLYFRPICDGSFFISNNLLNSKSECRNKLISFLQDKQMNKEGEYHTIKNFLQPVTLFGLEKAVEKRKEFNNLLEKYNPVEDTNSLSKCNFECIYDNDFKVENYKTLCSYDFDFFIVNVSKKDLEKARPFIEADKDKEDVLIVEIDETLYPESEFINELALNKTTFGELVKEFINCEKLDEAENV